MTIAEVFRPDGSATDMIDTMYDLFLGDGLCFGVAELQDGRQLFVFNGGLTVTEEDVLYELSAFLIDDGMSLAKMGMEIKNAMIDVN